MPPHETSLDSLLHSELSAVRDSVNILAVIYCTYTSLHIPGQLVPSYMLRYQSRPLTTIFSGLLWVHGASTHISPSLHGKSEDVKPS